MGCIPLHPARNSLQNRDLVAPVALMATPFV
jgi:hypothetical protein